MFFTNDDRGGWAAHDCSKTQILGTVAETIEWIYAELLANRSPDITY